MSVFDRSHLPPEVHARGIGLIHPGQSWNRKGKPLAWMWYDRISQPARDDERAGLVEWLRIKADQMDRKGCGDRGATLRVAAQMIEAGEDLKSVPT